MQNPSCLPSLPRLLHGGDYNPEQWIETEGVWEEDIALLERCGANIVSVGIFAWSRLEPTEGIYDFEWLGDCLDRLHRAGRQVFLATPSGAKPFWLSEKYPEVRRITRDGRRELSGNRHNQCWTSPIYREKLGLLNRALAQRFGQHPAVLAWHISNEYSGECFCDLCLDSFCKWLRERYETLENLNRAYWADFWSHSFSEWSQIDPRVEVLDGLILDWRRFVSWQAAEFFRFEKSCVREHSAYPVTTNLMGWYFGLDYHVLTQHADFISDDSYPGFDRDHPEVWKTAAETGMKFDLLRCMKGEPRPWILMESCTDGRSLWRNLKTKPSELHHLEMFQALAHGANGTLYFQWRQSRGGIEKFHGAVVMHNASAETRVFRCVTALSQRYEKLQALPETLNRAEVALIHDWESRYAYAASKGMPARANERYGVEISGEYYRPLWKRGVTVDVCDAGVDLTSYRLVILPLQFMVSEALAKQLITYVEQGGWLVFGGLGGLVGETNLCHRDGSPGLGLQEVLGVRTEEVDALHEGQQFTVRAVAGNSAGLTGSWNAGTWAVVSYLCGAEALISFADGICPGSPAVTSHTFGKGRAFAVLGELRDEAADVFYHWLIKERQLETFLPQAQPLPVGVTVQTRRAADGGQWHFIQNFSKNPQKLNHPHTGLVDAESGAPVAAEIALDPWEARVWRKTGA
jgi:beta-galactosidase